MKKYMIRFSIKDGDGQHQYDYCNDFLVDLPELMPGSQAEFEKAQYDMFKEKIAFAVKEWFKEDPDTVRDEIDQYGYGYDFETEDDGLPEVDYVIDRFPPRCVAHIPEVIMKRNGFQLAPEPTLDKEFYNDDGFILD